MPFFPFWEWDRKIQRTTTGSANHNTFRLRLTKSTEKRIDYPIYNKVIGEIVVQIEVQRKGSGN